jgi:hypothetical protein
VSTRPRASPAGRRRRRQPPAGRLRSPVADCYPGGAPVRKVLAVVAAHAVAALTDTGRSTLHRLGALGCSGVRVAHAGHAAAGEVSERDDADAWRAVLANAPTGHLDAEVAVGDQPPGAAWRVSWISLYT